MKRRMIETDLVGGIAGERAEGRLGGARGRVDVRLEGGGVVVSHGDGFESFCEKLI